MAEPERSTDTRDDPVSAEPWLEKIKDAETRFEKWAKECENADKLYSRSDRAESTDREYAIFWANLEVLRPAVYARPPVPVVAARFTDRNPVARGASEVVERSLIVSFDQGDIDSTMRTLRDEYLRYGRGTSWLRFSQDRRGAAVVSYDFVTRADFLHSDGRTWPEVSWVARRAWPTREAGIARFGEKFRSVPLKKRDQNAVMPDKGDKAEVWEIWDQDSGNVIWVAPGHKEVLDEQPAFLDLQKFFPCPRPAYGTVIPGTLIPVPDIKQYKDQIEEINEYTARISALSETLRLKGFYPAGMGDISEAIEVAIKNIDNRAILVPISSFAALGGGSFKDSVVWMPVGEALALIQGLVDLRRVVIDDVYQITGISDIVRGQTDPNETKGAQELKSQWGSVRIRERQAELTRVAREMTQIAGEIMAENFPPEQMLEMSQVKLPTAQEKQQAQMFAQQAQAQQQPIPKEVKKALDDATAEEVFAFLRNDRLRGFVIEIETDSTIQPNEDAEKKRRIEFVTAVGGLMQQAGPMIQMFPQSAPLMGEVLKFTASGFRAGRQLEAQIDNFVESLEGLTQMANQPKPPDPKVQGEQIKLETTKVKAQADVMKAQADMQQTKLDGQIAVQEHQMSLAEHQMRMREMMVEAAMPKEAAAQ